MAHIVILGAGTAGTIMANRLRRRFATEIGAGVTDIVVIDQDDRHVYQPGLLFVPFGIYRPDEIVQSRRAQLHHDVRFRSAVVDRLHPADRSVELAGGECIPFDVCIVASGTVLAHNETEGLTGAGWGSRTFDFYTMDGAAALARTLDTWKGGRLVINIVEMPIKCPEAPLEFAFLADWFFTMRGMRGDVDITLVTPLDSAFANPACTRTLGHLLPDKGVRLVTAFHTRRVDGASGVLASWDDREVPFDLLVSVPVHQGARFVQHTPGLGDDAGFVKTDPHSLQSRLAPAIFAIGDAADVPASKVGSVAHFESEILVENIARFLDGVALAQGFDGHTNSFIETGFDKALLIDFNYETEPLPGMFPLATLGPMPLLEESRINHAGKMAFKWIYWNVLLPGHDIPGVGPRMSMHGKHPAESSGPK